MVFNKVEGNVTAARGFSAAGIHCGIKKNKKDLALIYSEVPAKAAGTYTKNRFQAAPVIVSRENLQNGKARAVICNSGNANACSGEQGLQDARRMAALTAEMLSIDPGEVVVSSTGVIGQYLPMEIVDAGIRQVAKSLSPQGGPDAAEAIMTTDLISKEVAYEVEIGGETVTVGGIAKGSGMIHPNMATMLAFITTDCAISTELLQKALKYTVDRSYNLITVDGDTSTNDMAVMLANGLAGNAEITSENQDYQRFVEVLQRVNTELSQKIVRDGEGATKFLEVRIEHAASFLDGKTLAMGILDSNLVKTAFFGEDANWGRIVSAMGQTDVEFYPERVNIWLGDLQVTKDGQGLHFDEDHAKEILKHKDITIRVDLGMGEETVTAWGSDLSYEYVTINASYRS
ncbi:bifunctional glutamate N-acetyltransferase/amino-acid acetyltransferase ArgJ [Dethiobacter alkaliphilus]|uniref:bifunctional glutamate N-acetyltransferase/amino-acid acetyltransferase ArgJ n=1 Tax=Dethiobacter alkaliphilus TaxID=427926 RepID=UPI002227B041|nr:bifunctional glutamate N-acetyltransferase/amino-acid acetyltransferase ArgJ [Dethiobacter alkaliphilus]MCW3490075.1 bifunctional glutamate N-acetyltransferase/amino-acid acetyltransferase ArgJ [Dethiobacter alkaliphilus]